MTPVFFEACLMTGFKGKTLVSKCPTFQGLFRLTDAGTYVAGVGRTGEWSAQKQ